MSTVNMKEQEFQTRYPDYDVLDKWSSPDWDDQTREVVRGRLEEVPEIRFFTETEARTLAAVAERVGAQPGRAEAEEIPLVPWVDGEDYEEERGGDCYGEVPPQSGRWGD